MNDTSNDNLISFEDETDNFDVRKPCTSIQSCKRDKVKLRRSSSSRPPEMVTAVYDYEAKFSDELNLKRGSTIEVLSKDAKVSGDEGWWTGKLKTEDQIEKVGIFPSNFVQSDLNATLINLETQQSPNGGSNFLSTALYVDFAEIKFETLIGVGGFGKVHRATWRGQTVAVKAAHFEPGLNSDQVKECVEREARLFHLLSHPNIVSLVGVSLTPPNLCLLLEYCAGEALNKILRLYSHTLSADVLIDWAMQIARGMYYLHEQAPVPLVHRDLKSSNVLVKEDISAANFKFRNATVKISDFGLAREAYHTTRMSMCGTYPWMAPEVIKFSTFSKASDVWSFGVLLWELLTGETPYKNIDAMAIAYGVAVNQLTLPIPSTCPEPFAKMMADCWSVEPHKRPSFRQLLSSLEHFASTTDRIEDESFHTLQKNWREEIQVLFGEIKSLENELREKEEHLRNTAARQEIKEEILRQREAELEHRELELVHRELQLLLLKPIEPPLRHGKTKFFGGKHATGENISLPTDFRSLISVKHVLPHHRTSSQSPPLSPQGSRGELRVLAYDPGTAKLSSPESPPLAGLAHQQLPTNQVATLNFSTLKNNRSAAKTSDERRKAFHCSSPNLLQQNVTSPTTTPEGVGSNVALNVPVDDKSDKMTGLRNSSDCKAADFKTWTTTETDTDDEFFNGSSTTPRQTPKKTRKSMSSSLGFGVVGGGGGAQSGFWGAKLGDALRSITTVLSAVPLGRNVGDQVVRTPCGTAAVVLSPLSTTTAAKSPTTASPRRVSNDNAGALDYLNRHHWHTVSNPASTVCSPAKRKTPRIFHAIPADWRSVATTGAQGSPGLGFANYPSSTGKNRSRKPIPSDRYRSYTRTSRPRSCDPAGIAAQGLSNPNYERHFIGRLRAEPTETMTSFPETLTSFPVLNDVTCPPASAASVIRRLPPPPPGRPLTLSINHQRRLPPPPLISCTPVDDFTDNDATPPSSTTTTHDDRRSPVANRRRLPPRVDELANDAASASELTNENRAPHYPNDGVISSADFRRRSTPLSRPSTLNVAVDAGGTLTAPLAGADNSSSPSVGSDSADDALKSRRPPLASAESGFGTGGSVDSTAT